jgi:hypothetical protein
LAATLSHPDVVDKACSPLRNKAGDEEVAKEVATLEAKHQEHLVKVTKQFALSLWLIRILSCGGTVIT